MANIYRFSPPHNLFHSRRRSFRPVTVNLHHERASTRETPRTGRRTANPLLDLMKLVQRKNHRRHRQRKCVERFPSSSGANNENCQNVTSTRNSIGLIAFTTIQSSKLALGNKTAGDKVSPLRKSL